MKKTVDVVGGLRVEVRTVGHAFAVCGRVTRRGKVVAQTRDYPYGQVAQARQAARDLRAALLGKGVQS